MAQPQSIFDGPLGAMLAQQLQTKKTNPGGLTSDLPGLISALSISDYRNQQSEALKAKADAATQEAENRQSGIDTLQEYMKSKGIDFPVSAAVGAGLDAKELTSKLLGDLDSQNKATARKTFMDAMSNFVNQGQTASEALSNTFASMSKEDYGNVASLFGQSEDDIKSFSEWAKGMAGARIEGLVLPVLEDALYTYSETLSNQGGISALSKDPNLVFKIWDDITSKEISEAINDPEFQQAAASRGFSPETLATVLRRELDKVSQETNRVTGKPDAGKNFIGRLQSLMEISDVASEIGARNAGVGIDQQNAQARMIQATKPSGGGRSSTPSLEAKNAAAIALQESLKKKGLGPYAPQATSYGVTLTPGAGGFLIPQKTQIKTKGNLPSTSALEAARRRGLIKQ